MRAALCAAAALVAGQKATAAAPRVPAFWSALAQCETGGRWDWGSRHGTRRRVNEGSVYEGGLGFYAATWRAWAGAVGVVRQFPHAYVAPPAVQVRVARYGLARGGYWGCLHQHPHIYRLPGR